LIAFGPALPRPPPPPRLLVAAPSPGTPFTPKNPAIAKAPLVKRATQQILYLTPGGALGPDSPLLLLPLHSEKSCPLV